MTVHNLYIAKSFKLGSLVFAGLTSIERTRRKTQVVPKVPATLRRQKAFTTGIEETLSIECEDPGTVLPAGPVTMEAKGCVAATGETFGDEITIATVASATVEIIEDSVAFNGEASGRLRFQLAVNSADGIASGLTFQVGVA